MSNIADAQDKDRTLCFLKAFFAWIKVKGPLQALSWLELLTEALSIRLAFTLSTSSCNMIFICISLKHHFSNHDHCSWTLYHHHLWQFALSHTLHTIYCKFMIFRSGDEFYRLSTFNNRFKTIYEALFLRLFKGLHLGCLKRACSFLLSWYTPHFCNL